MTSLAIFVLGLIVSVITGLGVFMIGLQEAADPDRQVEDLSALEKRIVGRSSPDE